MAEDTRSRLPEPEHLALRPDQPPPPTADELAAISAVMNCRGDRKQEAIFVTYLLKLTGYSAGETMASADFWAFNAGKRWVATSLLGLADVRLVPMGVRRALEDDTHCG